MVVPLVMRVEGAVDMIYQQRNKLGAIKLIVSNFQKNDDILFTSDRSLIEVDDEVSVP